MSDPDNMFDRHDSNTNALHSPKARLGLWLRLTLGLRLRRRLRLRLRPRLRLRLVYGTDWDPVYSSKSHLRRRPVMSR